MCWVFLLTASLHLDKAHRQEEVDAAMMTLTHTSYVFTHREAAVCTPATSSMLAKQLLSAAGAVVCCLSCLCCSRTPCASSTPHCCRRSQTVPWHSSGEWWCIRTLLQHLHHLYVLLVKCQFEPSALCGGTCMQDRLHTCLTCCCCCCCMLSQQVCDVWAAARG